MLLLYVLCSSALFFLSAGFYVASSFTVSFGLALCADSGSLIFLCTLISISTTVLI